LHGLPLVFCERGSEHKSCIRKQGEARVKAWCARSAHTRWEVEESGDPSSADSRTSPEATKYFPRANDPSGRAQHKMRLEQMGLADTTGFSSYLTTRPPRRPISWMQNLFSADCVVCTFATFATIT
jgi:hypothetical protein